jgi:hypothetical protein
MQAILRRDPMLRKAGRARLGRTHAAIKMGSGKLRRSTAAGVQLEIIRHTAGRIPLSIVRRILAFGPVMAIRGLRLRDIWATG